MDLEFIASVAPAGNAVAAAGRLDPDYPVQAAGLAAEAGFDKLLVGYDPSAPDGLLVASQILTTTSSLGVVITHLPGLVSPTVAARQYATLGAFHHGRAGMHVIIDEPVLEARPEGVLCEPAARPRRAAEFLDVVRLAWSSARAFTYSGEFYQVAGAGSALGPSEGSLPVYVSADIPGAERVAIAHGDICVLSCSGAPELAAKISRLRTAAAKQGRSPRFAVSLRLRTGAFAWPAGGELSWIPPVPGQAVLTGSHDKIAAELLGLVGAGASTLILGHDPHADSAACAEIIARVRDVGEANSW